MWLVWAPGKGLGPSGPPVSNGFMPRRAGRPPLFVPQGLDGVHVRGAGGGVEAEDDANGD
jgi:hypothetical protein